MSKKSTWVKADLIGIEKSDPQRIGIIMRLVVPANAFTKCKECDRYFVNLTERERLYCSPICAWRFLAKKKREEMKKDPRKYREYLKRQREYMRGRYQAKSKRPRKVFRD
jgi:hypothetical protein